MLQQSITCWFFYTSVYYLLVFLNFDLLLACSSTHQSKPWNQTNLQQFGSKKMNSLDKGQSSPSYQHPEETGPERYKLQLIRKRESQKFQLTIKRGIQKFQLTRKREIQKFQLTIKREIQKFQLTRKRGIQKFQLTTKREILKFPLTGQKKRSSQSLKMKTILKTTTSKWSEITVNKTITPEKSKLQKLCWHHRE